MSGTGSLVAITAEDSFYVLRFDRDAYNIKVEEGAEITDEKYLNLLPKCQRGKSNIISIA